MVDANKSVFISYRRKQSQYVARSIFQHLRQLGYDVFLDVEDLRAGKLDALFTQIAARAHFVVILTPGSLQGAGEPDDWMRREIEHAIRLRRNIVPILAEEFDFRKEATQFRGQKLPGKLNELRTFTPLPLHHETFNAGMAKLCTWLTEFGSVPEIKPMWEADLRFLDEKLAGVSRMRPVRELFGASPGLGPGAPGELPWFTIRPPRLSVPKAGPVIGKLEWTSVLGGGNYILEKSSDPSFPSRGTVEAYSGETTAFEGLGLLPQPSVSQHYRVKAENKLFDLESPWSNVITVEARRRRSIFLQGLSPQSTPSRSEFDLLGPVPPPSELFSALPGLGRLSAPTLEVSSFPEFGLGAQLKWTSVPGATGYQLESSHDESFSEPVQVHRGKETRQFVLGLSLPSTTYYRVRATDGIRSGRWSNVVAVEKKPKPTPAPEVPRLRLSDLRPGPTGSAPLLQPAQWRLSLFAFPELPAPTLELVPFSGVRWTSVPEATRYQLESSCEPTFSKPQQVYEGTDTFHSTLLSGGLACLYYRVMATDGLRFSPWSNVVKG
jgi:hypothetical protein